MAFDRGLYEVRLLTVISTHRRTHLALLLMYGAFRYLECAGARTAVAIGRLELIDFYRRAGLAPLGLRTTSGAVTYELMSDLRARVAASADVASHLERAVDWKVDGVPFRSNDGCYHGGAFFDAIGDEFDALEGKDAIINADVLDAWFDPAPSVVNKIAAHLAFALRTSPPIEYAGPGQSLEAYAAASTNVVVCKSMSKVYALSGARAAYLCGPPAMIAELQPLCPPWSVGLPGQIAACEAVRSTPYYRERWAETHRLRDELFAQLSQLGWDVIPGCANFLLCHIPAEQPNAAALVAACRKRGLFVRDVRNMGRVFDGRVLRVSVKDAKTNQAMVDILRAVLGEINAAVVTTAA